MPGFCPYADSEEGTAVRTFTSVKDCGGMHNIGSHGNEKKWHTRWLNENEFVIY